MPGLGQSRPDTHEFGTPRMKDVVDSRDKPGRDGKGSERKA
jgi:hypothetical protein